MILSHVPLTGKTGGYRGINSKSYSGGIRSRTVLATVARKAGIVQGLSSFRHAKHEVDPVVFPESVETGDVHVTGSDVSTGVSPSPELVVRQGQYKERFPFRAPLPTVVMSSDVSDGQWGGHIDDQEVSGTGRKTC